MTDTTSTNESGSNVMTWVLALLGIAAIGGGIYLVWPEVKRRMGNPTAQSQASNPVTNTATTINNPPAGPTSYNYPISNNSTPTISNNSSTASSKFPLKRGSRGNEVENVQITSVSQASYDNMMRWIKANVQDVADANAGVGPQYQSQPTLLEG